MIAAVLLQVADVPTTPADWAALAPVPYLTTPSMTPDYANFVAGEIRAGRCKIAKPADGHYVIKVDVATLIGADGMVRRTMPHAIDCPTVEQYAAGLVTGFARSNLAVRTGTNDTWYRATIIFDWR